MRSHSNVHSLRLPALSGLFNLLFSPSGAPLDGDFRVASWNARGLFHGDATIRRRKIRFLDRVLKLAGVVHVQEAHGSQAAIDQYLFFHSKRFRIFGSFLESAAGGVLTFVSKKLAPNFEDVIFVPTVVGRVA